MNYQEIKEEMERKGLKGVHVTPEWLERIIADEAYYVFPGTMKTVCCLIAENGFTVIGESACMSEENFDEELGRKIARDKARDKLAAFEAYRQMSLVSDVDDPNLAAFNTYRNRSNKGD